MGFGLRVRTVGKFAKVHSSKKKWERYSQLLFWPLKAVTRHGIKLLLK